MQTEGDAGQMSQILCQRLFHSRYDVGRVILMMQLQDLDKLAHRKAVAHLLPQPLEQLFIDRRPRAAPLT